MKKLLLILTLLCFSVLGIYAQDDERDGNERIRDRMNEYIQKRLHLSKDEAQKFTPVFFPLLQGVAIHVA